MLSIRPFEGADVESAGHLLAARHRRERALHPLLPATYDDPGAAADAVREVFAAEDASGAVAERDGRMVGYLVGAPKSDASWGSNVWVEGPGVAAEDEEDARDLYAAAAAGWVAEGRVAHYVLVPAGDPLERAFYRLAFGHQHTHAIMPTPSAVQVDTCVRRARRPDIPALARLEVSLPEHLRRSPVFSSVPVPTLAEVVAEYEGDFDDPDFATFVTEVDGVVVGSAIGSPIEKSGMHKGLTRPDGAGLLGFAAVLPEARGRGLGRRLGDAVLAWCHERGYPSVVTDWREANLEASRAWRAMGFTPTYTRLHRLVGH
jgi:ribosomal protein S18 acetylase RimI-like enzyme